MYLVFLSWMTCCPVYIVSNGGGNGYWTQCHTFSIPTVAGEIHQCLYDKIAALSAILSHLERFSTIGDHQVEVRGWLVLILAALQRKREYMSIKNGVLKNFEDRFKI
jgi:hypothetical protein